MPYKGNNTARTAEMPLKPSALHLPLLSTVKSENVLGFLLTLKFPISSFQRREEGCRILIKCVESMIRASQILQNSPLTDFEVSRGRFGNLVWLCQQHKLQNCTQ